MGGADESRKRVLREILSQLHSGVSPQEVKDKFRQFLESVSAEEIARIEQELVKEGLPREEIQRLCNVHLAVFKEQLEKQRPFAKPETPINTLTEEHKVLQQISEELGQVADKIVKAENANSISNEISQLREIAIELLDAEKHYLREENVLSPLLEKHGITEPPAIMWMEHNQLREKKKKLRGIVENYGVLNFKDFKKQLGEVSKSIIEVLSSHIFKENNILFPTALRVVTEQEWRDAQKDFDEIGYCCFTPQHLIAKSKAKEEVEVMPVPEGILQFKNGTLSKEEIEALLDTLPVDVTFVDANDNVKYFNKAEKRIFVRTKAVIGRKVQLCHPQKSVHIVNRILEAFKKGEKDVAEFWIQRGNSLIHIRYFAVRDKNGKYLGTLEVTQDITDIKKIEGEKRLLDWEG
ncbi:MAG: DUF438 domain-containing protein [Candidatus Bathyarchaeales archaeon]